VRIFDAIVSDGQLDESTLSLRELTQIRETLIASLNALYHARVDYPAFNVTSLPPTAESQADHEQRGVTYAKASDVPINPSGEVEAEAITREAGNR
jgi:hypothetical protein